MAKSFVVTFLVILDMSAVFGLSIFRKEVINATDGYQVTEDKLTNTLKFNNPKPEKPTLREIIYYHVIETPYEQVNNEHIINIKHNKVENDNKIIGNAHIVQGDHDIVESNHNNAYYDHNKVYIDQHKIENFRNQAKYSSKELDFDESRRSWTNSHGYQYFKADSENQGKPNEDVKSSFEDKIIDSEHEEPAVFDQNILDNINETKTADPPGPVADDVATNLDSQEDDIIPGKNELDKDSVTESSGIPPETEPVQKAPEDIGSAQNMEWTDFIQDAKERKRRKREIDYTKLGNPPSLPPLDLDILPDFIKAMLGTDKPELVGVHPVDASVDKIGNQIDRLEERVEEITARGERSAAEERKSYGMSLTGDSGVVWNNLSSKKSLYGVGIKNNEIVDLGNKETSYSVRKRNTDIEENKNLDPVERKNTDDDVIDAKIHKFENELEEPDLENPIKPSKTYGMSLSGDHGIVWNDLNGQRVSYHVGETTGSTEEKTTENHVIETTTKSNIDKTSDEPKPSEENVEDQSTDSSKEIDNSKEINNNLNVNSIDTDKPKNNTEILNEIVEIIKEVFKNETAKLENKANCNNGSKAEKDGKSEDDDNVTTEVPVSTETPKADDDSKDEANHTSPLPDTIQELMKNEQFWKWLNDWSTVYLDLLANRMDNHIKEEVAKQIEQYFATHDQGNTKPGENDTDVSGNIKENTKNGTTSEIDSSKSDDKTFKGNMEEEEDSLSAKRRKDKECDDKKEKEPVIIESNTIYGNSVGNDKVTNVFIFNINNKSDLDNIKPLVNGTNGIYVFGNDDKEPDENKQTDKNSEETSEPNKTQEDISLTTERPQDNVESTALPENKDSNNNKESTLSDGKEEKQENVSNESTNLENNNTNDDSDNVSGHKDAKHDDQAVNIDERIGSHESTDNNDIEKNTDTIAPEETEIKQENGKLEEDTTEEVDKYKENPNKEKNKEDNMNEDSIVKVNNSNEDIDKGSKQKIDNNDNDSNKSSKEDINKGEVGKGSTENIGDTIKDITKEDGEKRKEADDKQSAVTEEIN